MHRHISQANLALLPTAIFVLRRNGQIEFANPAAEALCASSQWLGRAAGRLIRVGSRKDVDLKLLFKQTCEGIVAQAPFVYRDANHRPAKARSLRPRSHSRRSMPPRGRTPRCW